jgi:hypothetical protein
MMNRFQKIIREIRIRLLLRKVKGWCPVHRKPAVAMRSKRDGHILGLDRKGGIRDNIAGVAPLTCYRCGYPPACEDCVAEENQPEPEPEPKREREIKKHWLDEWKDDCEKLKELLEAK